MHFNASTPSLFKSIIQYQNLQIFIHLQTIHIIIYIYFIQYQYQKRNTLAYKLFCPVYCSFAHFNILYFVHFFSTELHKLEKEEQCLNSVDSGCLIPHGRRLVMFMSVRWRAHQIHNECEAPFTSSAMQKQNIDHNNDRFIQDADMTIT